MVQIEVEGVFLDLYDLDPPKLNFSIEDITDTSTRSVFSRTFRVPATPNNNTFFTNAFEINGVDFDITIKRSARLYVNGALFRIGQLRLNNIYDNREGSRIDYECLFLGETKDFGTSVGEGYLNELDLSGYTHLLEYTAVTQSWEAYPSGTTTDGLFNGDILYPLIDFGVNYDSDGVPIETRISQSNTGDHFTQNSHPLSATRFKPMIRAKVLWDKIFESAGYTYTSNFIDSDRFLKIYVSAFGNTDNIITETTENECSIRTNFNDSNTSLVQFNDEIFDSGNNFNTTTHRYTAPESGTYEILCEIPYFATADEFSTGQLTVRLRKNGTITLASDQTGLFTGDDSGTLQIYFNGTVGATEYLEVDVVDSNLAGWQIEQNSTFNVLEAPGKVAIAPLLDDNYKQIDFIKDILTKFRLVMIPDKNKVGNFIIEPWATYMATGDLFDWTEKLDLTKDVQISPVFYTQSARINFEDSEGEDFLNIINQEQFKEVFGKLIVNGNNDLLDGSRDITTNIIPTPITQIERKNTTIGHDFIIPQIHVHEPGEDPSYNPQHLPIVGNTRLLFYNGTYDTDGIDWYLEFDPNSPYDIFPMVSFYEDFPNTSSSLNLNWQKERGYIEHDVNNGLLGNSVYDEYWSTYINSLYDGFARKVTAYFVLDDTDLLDFSFDDVIFVKNAYYYVSKISDVPVGKKASVKVELIKLNNYNVNEGGFIPPTRLWNTTDIKWEDANFRWDV